MELRPKIDPAIYASAKVSCLSHLAKTVTAIKGKLAPRQLSMFRKTIFGHLLNVDLVFNGSLVHNILLREVEDSTTDSISFNLFGRKVSFGRREFDLISGLKYDGSLVKKDTHVHRLRALYFNDRFDLVLSDLEDLYEAAQFQDDFDAVKVSIVYMVEMVLLGRERTVKFDQTLLGIVDD
ncbi:uncharacterized protein LOC111025123 [Momordica charantia]|uniref:Uncharacterized protein LOC111025123 n=1 Tax=Momordica charantia TaxID=3673 RepID=A0A6J1DWG2_MOMCH|nr:uncharacterized protein LOC111025123 [Momordica charantia]